MLQARLLLLALLVPVAGAFALLGGTSAVHGVVMLPYETAQSVATGALGGAVARFASATVDAAARAASDGDVIAALSKKQMTPKAEAALLSAAGGFGAPSFALLIGADGNVIARAGADAKLPDALGGLPVVAEALSGVARDGLWIQDGKPVHLVASASYEGGNPIGGVILGWNYTPELTALLGRLTGQTFIVVGEKTAIGAFPEGVAAEALLARSAFGEPTMTMGVLPILVPEKTRYSVASAPLYPGETSFVALTLIDRDPAFSGIASIQLGLLGVTLALGLLIIVVVVSTMRSVSRPLELIMDHLSQVQQGNNVGILPEAGLSGGFLRLGKQINMILQTLPSARPGTAPIGSFGGPHSSPNNDPMGDALAPDFPGLVAKAPSVKTAPPSTTSQPIPAVTVPNPPATTSPPAGPIPSASTPPTAPAAAPPAPSTSAAPSSGLANLFDEGPDPLAAFRVPPKPASPPPSPAPPAVQAQQPAPDLPEPPAHAMNPEATVMFQVPEALLAASALDEKRKAQQQSQPPAPPPVARPPVDDNRTVVAQVPQELLAQVAPKNDVAAADEAHYKEVYEKFVQTRIECGEDTSDLSYDRFVAKLLKNRQQIVEKHKAKSVRFQVYVKDGKAALRALPVRE